MTDASARPPSRTRACSSTVGCAFLGRASCQLNVEAPNEVHAAWRVKLATWRANLLLDVASEAEARRLVRALGHTPDQRLATFRFFTGSEAKVRRVGVLFAAVSAGLILATAFWLPGWVSQIWGMCVGLTALPFISWYLSVTVEIGLDAVRLRYPRPRRAQRSDRVIPLAAVSAVCTGDRLRIEEHGTLVEELFVRGGWDIFLSRLAEARRLAAAAHATTPTLATAPKEDYRSAAYPQDVLLRVVADPTQSAEARLTAARALHASLDHEERAQIRVAAQTTASPELRAQLEELAQEAPPSGALSSSRKIA